MLIFTVAREDRLGSRTITSSTDAIMNHAIGPLATIHDTAPCLYMVRGFMGKCPPAPPLVKPFYIDTI